VDLSGGSGQIASALWNQIDAEVPFLMATPTVGHEQVMSSIEMFGTHVIPELGQRATV
jgi:hypothetical protein